MSSKIPPIVPSMPHVWINGRLIDEAEASVPLRDTGLLHAAGAFTTLRADGSHIFRLPAHLKRLRTSCDALSIPLPYDDAELSQAMSDLLARNELLDARLRLTVTRGSAIQDPVHGLALRPTVFLTAAELEPYPPEFYRTGMTVLILDDQKLNPYDLQAGHKTLNYFSRLAALRDANQRRCGEALWFNVHNLLQSGSISNVFIVKNNVLLTPPTQDELSDPDVQSRTPHRRSNVLPGVTRAAILELARASGIEARIGAIDINALLDADEVFLTNSIMRLMPVTRIEQKPIAGAEPGPITRKLTADLADQIAAEADVDRP